MVVHSIALPQANPLVQDYLAGKAEALQFFQYAPYDPASFPKRLEWLRRHPCAHREQLAAGLLAYNQQIGNHEHALKQMERLGRPDTYVVIAGQQAGALTGPLYTIYKAIHLVQLAGRLSQELGVEVIPVFWIAGEDHDLEEINHLYQAAEGSIRKVKLDLRRPGKKSASMLPLEQQAVQQFVAQYFAGLTETGHTASLRALAEETGQLADTPADWFARLMARLFGKHGLVLVESSLPFVRQLEQPVFGQMVERNEAISAVLAETERQLLAAGYPAQLSLDPRSANIFLYENNERILLERDGEQFVSRDRQQPYCRSQLLELLAGSPDKFSANVVSRPLMQEHLFPTLAFIGGPGEVAYWAYFKEYFSLMGYQLPVIVPRMSVTLLEGAIERHLAQFELNPAEVLSGYAAWKDAWLAKVEREEGADKLLAQFTLMRESIGHMYRGLVDDVIRFDPGLSELAGKNQARLLEQMDFLEDRVKRTMRQRHAVALSRLERIEQALLPEGKWQERVYNYFAYANHYGANLLDRLIACPFPHVPAHHIIQL